MRLGSVLLGITVLLAPEVSQVRSTIPAVPVEPIKGIVEALRTHQVVALGEYMHVSPEDQSFRLPLIRDSALSEVLNDIVVEFGNSRLQEPMDRYMEGGDDPINFLAQVVRSALPAFQNPIYEEFFRTVRAVNDKLPPARRIRVLLGESPDFQSRDPYVANLIRREVLDRHRRALVLYGDEHVTRRHPIFRDQVPEERTFVTLLESSGERVFSIWAHRCSELIALQPVVASWPRPSLTMVQGNVLGSADYYFYSPIEAWRLAPKQRRMEEMVDALLCLDR